jgi:hypothetical protein
MILKVENIIGYALFSIVRDGKTLDLAMLDTTQINAMREAIAVRGSYLLAERMAVIKVGLLGEVWRYSVIIGTAQVFLPIAMLIKAISHAEQRLSCTLEVNCGD